MPRRGLISIIFTIAGLRLIVGYVPPAQAGIGGIEPDPSTSPAPDATPTPAASSAATPTPGTTATPKPTATPQPTTTPKPTPKPTAAATLHSGTYTGSKFDYNYGTMQVTIEISGGKVVNASVAQNGRWAIGYRRSACTESVFNSAAIDLSAGASSGSEFMSLQPSACSGATYSWWGYANSLQSAIDQATY